MPRRDPLAEVREKLLILIDRSELSREDFARWFLGINRSTLYRWLAGGTIPVDRLEWLLRLERCEVLGKEVHLVLRRGAVGPQFGAQVRARHRREAYALEQLARRETATT